MCVCVFALLSVRRIDHMAICSFPLFSAFRQYDRRCWWPWLIDVDRTVWWPCGCGCARAYLPTGIVSFVLCRCHDYWAICEEIQNRLSVANHTKWTEWTAFIQNQLESPSWYYALIYTSHLIICGYPKNGGLHESSWMAIGWLLYRIIFDAFKIHKANAWISYHLKCRFQYACYILYAQVSIYKYEHGFCMSLLCAQMCRNCALWMIKYKIVLPMPYT